MSEEPAFDPVDRRERVRVLDRGGFKRRQTVVEDAGAARRHTLFRVSQFIWLVFGVVITLIGLRVVLKLIVANPSNSFADLVYDVTAIFLRPFIGLTNTPATSDGMVLEIPSIIAMFVYALVAYGIVRLVYVLFSKSSVRREQVYEQE